MSLWEVSEALNLAASQPAAADARSGDFGLADLDALQALVAEEESEMMILPARGEEPPDDIAATQRFVDSVFADGAEETIPELTLARTETTEASEYELQDRWFAMLQKEPCQWDLNQQLIFEGPKSPSPTSVTALFGAALSPHDIDGVSARNSEVFHEALILKCDSCAAQSTSSAPATRSPGVTPPLLLPATPRHILPPLAQLGSSSRNGAERKEWTTAEDEIIRSSVLIYGCKWRRIASLLPGRSDDAVRNRWNRLKEQMSSIVHASVALAPTVKRTPSTGCDVANKPERVSWTKVEDATILSSVVELGHKWNKLAERLPGRTDHAIRNRFHRLQTMLEDRQRAQQRVLAPSQLLPPAAPLMLA